MDAHARMRRSHERAPIRGAGPPVKSRSLLPWMLLAICAVAAAAYWDAQREFASALADFAGEQHALARAVALALRHPLVRSKATTGGGPSVTEQNNV